MCSTFFNTYNPFLVATVQLEKIDTAQYCNILHGHIVSSIRNTKNLITKSLNTGLYSSLIQFSKWSLSGNPTKFGGVKEVKKKKVVYITILSKSQYSNDTVLWPIYSDDIISWSLWRVLPLVFRHIFKLDAIWIMFKCFLYKTWWKNYLRSNTFNLNTYGYAMPPTRYFAEGKLTVNLTVI